MVVAPKAGHAVHLEDPDLALGSVHNVLDRVNSGERRSDDPAKVLRSE